MQEEEEVVQVAAQWHSATGWALPIYLSSCLSTGGGWGYWSSM